MYFVYLAYLVLYLTTVIVFITRQRCGMRLGVHCCVYEGIDAVLDFLLPNKDVHANYICSGSGVPQQEHCARNYVFVLNSTT